MENAPEIPINFEGGQKWITGLTPKTTCDDVIHSLLINMGCPIPHEAVRNYALFENWRGIERSLKGRSRFMKLVRDWGEEAPNVEITLRKIDSSVKDDAALYGGSIQRRKNRIKDWFKTKDKKSKNVSKSMQNIHQDEMHNIHDDSSILARDTDNMFCALSCYKKRQNRNGANRGGLRERDMNIQTPFERPHGVALNRSKSMSIQNPAFQDSVTPAPPMNAPLTRQYSVSQISQYGSRTSLKQTYITKHRSCYFDDEEEQENLDPVYSIAQEPFLPIEHHYASPTPKSVRRMRSQNVHDWDYDYNRETPYDSEAETDTETALRTALIPASSKTDYNDTRFKSLLNLVLSQERKIQEQFSRIKDADKRIEHYELTMHRLRSAQQGQDYLQDTYLSVHDETLTDEGLKAINELENMCDKVTAVDDRIREQYEKLHDLSLQLDAETKQLEESIHADIHADDHELYNTTQPDGPFESTRLSPNSKSEMDPEIRSQIAGLRADLQRSIGMSITQQHEIKSMDQNLKQYQAEVKAKQDRLSALIRQLNVSNDDRSAQNSITGSNDGYLKPVPVRGSIMCPAPAVPRAMTRQLKSMGDLQGPVTSARPVFQPGMRKSISDLRETLQNHPPSVLQKYSDASCDFFESHTHHPQGTDFQRQPALYGKFSGSIKRTMLPMPPVVHREQHPIQTFTEMGVDVGFKSSIVTSNLPHRLPQNETDDIKNKQQHDPNKEVQKILASRTPVLTPIKEQDFTHTILEYHNETVDLDALLSNEGRAQDPGKMFQDKEQFQPIDRPNTHLINTNISQSVSETTQKQPFATLIYEAEISDIETLSSSETASSAVADLSLNHSESNRSAFLPPLGLETIANIKGRSLMPCILDETVKEGESTLEAISESTTTCVLSENTSVWGTPTVMQHDKTVEQTVQHDKTVEQTNKTHNSTSIWNSHDNARDGTFTVSNEPKCDAQAYHLPGELTALGYDSTMNDATESNASFSNSVEASAHVIRETIALSLGVVDSPSSSLSSVKKRLFDDENNSDITASEFDEYDQENSSSDLQSEQPNIEKKSTKQVLSEIHIPEITHIESALSPLSTTTDSTESGVCSMPSGDLHDDLQDESDLQASNSWTHTETTV